jgi:hypothetical protein
LGVIDGRALFRLSSRTWHRVTRRDTTIYFLSVLAKFRTVLIERLVKQKQNALYSEELS